ncbi:hypothetical protein RJ640_007092, partial [Escallonia rubra]
ILLEHSHVIFDITHSTLQATRSAIQRSKYNDERVVKYFDLRKCVCVSDEFDIRKIIGKIVDKESLTLQRLQEHLQETLSAKRYLLILDDVWNEDLQKWRELSDLLLCGAPGSKIVMTTRSPLVVSTLDPIYVHNLAGLSDKESLFLFMELASGKGQMEQHQNLKKIGEQIVRKCKGVPLAITTLGSLLHMNTEVKEWCYVRDDPLWNLPQTPGSILPALKLSYNHLPPHLKRCFAVCAIFPKDYDFQAFELINIWMALGLLGSRYQLEEGEDIGKKYFTELCSRSFFQDVKNFNWDCSFIMHDLALSVIGSERLDLAKDSPKVPNQKIHHVYFSNRDPLRNGFPSSVLQLKNLRTIRVEMGIAPLCSQSFVDTYLLRFKCLRILDLRSSQFETLPRSIGSLKHLKYLDISWNGNLKSPPTSLCELQSLQTLQLEGCWELEELPRNFGDLISLRYLSLTTRQRFLPLNVFRRLTCLRTLKFLCCYNLECLFQTKGNKTRGIPRGLRKLDIMGCVNLGSLPGLPYLTRLECLIIVGSDKLDLRMDEESIREHGGGLTSLQRLDISHLPNLMTLPQWLVRSAPNTLKRLQLFFCPNLTTLPEDLNALQEIRLDVCPQLIERCQRGTGELNKLKDTLSTVKAVLVDAEELQETNAELSVWLEALKDVCYAIDDILDEFDVIALQQQVNQRSTQRKVRHFFSCSNPLVFRFRMGHKIKEIREKLDQIAADRNKFHLPHVERSLLPHRQRETHSYIIASNVIGRDHDKDLLVHKLVKVADGEGVAVIPILGIGGLGKTTLAKLVYNDQRVVNYFDLTKWVCVSDEFDVKRIIGNIVDKNNLTLEQLQQHLKDTLSTKRYLLILDDVWNEDLQKWRELSDLLLCGAPGSKIVVTTRSPLVVSTLDPIYVHNLAGLSDKESLFLFMELASGKGQMEQHQNLKKIGEQIVRKCKGVPLAIMTLGSLLHMNTEVKEWCSVRDNPLCNVEQTKGGFLPALKLSYYHLPPHLKRCFAVCAIFPKDYEFSASELIYKWMALGLLGSRYQPEEGEDIGKKYFTELCSRSFFQDVEYRRRSGFFMDTEFKMHDQMHDLALSIIGSESLILTKDSPMVPNQKFSPMVPNQKVQHVYFSNEDLWRNDFPSSLLQLRKLQTVMVESTITQGCSQSFVDTCVSRFKSLRILDLRDSIFATLPRSIGGLKHLKYLDISGNRNLKSLPRSLCKLQGLQTLQLEGCAELEELPRNFGDLISLRCLGLRTQERFLPVNIFQRLTCLRTLAIGYCYNLECLFQTKENKTQCIPRGLRDLKISFCPNLGSSSPGLPYLTSLVGLTLFDCDKLDLNMDEESIREHGGGLTSLQRLYIYSLPNLVTFPQWLVPSAANTLKQLDLEDCEKLMSMPGGLHALQRISIIDCPQLMSIPGGLDALKVIRIM